MLAQLRSPDAGVRVKALHRICPCGAGFPLYERFRREVRRLQKDPDLRVRAAALYAERDACETETIEAGLDRAGEQGWRYSDAGWISKHRQRQARPLAAALMRAGLAIGSAAKSATPNPAAESTRLRHDIIAVRDAAEGAMSAARPPTISADPAREATSWPDTKRDIQNKRASRRRNGSEHAEARPVIQVAARGSPGPGGVHRRLLWG